MDPILPIDWPSMLSGWSSSMIDLIEQLGPVLFPASLLTAGLSILLALMVRLTRS